jgi:hypothetical protein
MHADAYGQSGRSGSNVQQSNELDGTSKLIRFKSKTTELLGEGRVGDAWPLGIGE